MFKKILVATDGSQSALRACAEAGRIAKAFDSEITLLYVVYIPPFYRGDLGSGIEGSLIEDGTRILSASKKETEAFGVDAMTRLVREGDPADVIVKEAKAGGYDLIVIGSSGLGRAAPLELGSVSNRVSHDSKCSLLIIR